MNGGNEAALTVMTRLLSGLATDGLAERGRLPSLATAGVSAWKMWVKTAESRSTGMQSHWRTTNCKKESWLLCKSRWTLRKWSTVR